MNQLPDIDRVCQQILHAAGHIQPPTNLDSICGLWSDLVVSEDDLDKEGYLVPLGVHGAELIIRRRDSIPRKRFTIAHELGHWVLAHLKSGVLAFGSSNSRPISFNAEHKRRTPEEIWCNRFAASLLIPKNDLSDYLRNKDHGVARQIARGHLAFGVSEETFLLRVTNATRISVLEVVLNSIEFRIRRQFLSELEPLEDFQAKVEQLSNQQIEKYLNQPSCSIDCDNFRMYIERVRHSSSDSTLLICAVPSGKCLVD